MLDTETAREVWRASVFAHHARDIDGKVRLLDVWHDECEVALQKWIGRNNYWRQAQEPGYL